MFEQKQYWLQPILPVTVLVSPHPTFISTAFSSYNWILAYLLLSKTFWLHGGRGVPESGVTNVRFTVDPFKLTPFRYLVYSPYINFFVTAGVDMPIFFKKSLSLKRPAAALPHVKLINFAMRAGLRELAQRSVMRAFGRFFQWLRVLLTAQFSRQYPISQIVLLLKATCLDTTSSSYWFFFKSILPITFSNSLGGGGLDWQNTYFSNYYFLNKFLAMNPAFSFNIYKINKFIRKYSRGKSGKYTLVWKYTAPYKRYFIVMRWLLKDTKFTGLHQWDARLCEALKNFIFFPPRSFAYKSKRFIYTYVFKNFKKTLLSTLRSVG